MTEQTKSEMPTPKIPKCPHCGADMPTVNLFSWAAGMWLIFSVSCDMCLTVLKMQILPVAPQDPGASSPGGSRIMRPS